MDTHDALEFVQAESLENRAGNRELRESEHLVAKARTKNNMAAFSKLVGVVDGDMRIIAHPPLIEPLEEVVTDEHERSIYEEYMRGLLSEYVDTLPFWPHLLSEFEYVDMARKVVGVGSVGTRAWVVLLRGRDDGDPLLLQGKETESSVLEQFLPASEFENHGQRVVIGQRRMQAASDIFLGWQRAKGTDGTARDFYVRQFKDWKDSVNIDALHPAGAMLYAELCGEVLSRAHSRTGDRIEIASYLAKGNRFDLAIAEFAERYADQNEEDYSAFQRAIASGRLQSTPRL